MPKVVEVSNATREQLSERLAALREQVETLQCDILVENTQTQEAFYSLGCALDMMREAQGYLDEDDPNAEG
jgi:hypothetical protein